MRTFIDFGTTFDIQTRDYWQGVEAAILDSIYEMKPKDLISMITCLKDFGHLSTEIIVKTIAILKEKARTLTTPELAIMTMIYTSQEARSCISRD